MAGKINTRHSFTKEFKLKVVQFFYDHDKNCNQTATHFKVDKKKVGILFIEIPTFIILFILLLVFQILCPHSISCFVLIFSYCILVIAIFLPITVT